MVEEHRPDYSILSVPEQLCVICRGQAQHGELGYGANGKKSSANPDKCLALEGVYTHQVGSTGAAGRRAACPLLSFKQRNAAA